MKLRVRWATGPDDRPAKGEALARLSRIDETTERIRGGGRPAPTLRLDPDTGKLEPAGLRWSDLSIRRFRVLLSVETADGRMLATTFDDGAGVPALDDLRDAWQEAWNGGPDLGRPREDFTADVDKYAAEIDRRIANGEPTEIEVVAGFMGWVPKTIRRHIQWAGFADWTKFVAARRSRRLD